MAHHLRPAAPMADQEPWKGARMLYTRDPLTGDHLVVDGDETFRLPTRAEALRLAASRYKRSRAEEKNAKR